MATQLPRSVGYVCKLCRSQQLPNYSLRPFSIPKDRFFSRQHGAGQKRAASTQTSSRNATQAAISPVQRPRSQPLPRPSQSAPNDAKTAEATSRSRSPSSVPIDAADASGSLRKIRAEVNALAVSGGVDQQKVLELLDQSYQVSNLLIFGQTAAPEEQNVEEQDGDASLLTDLDESVTTTKSATATPKVMNLPMSHREKLAAEVCQTVYDLLKIPTVAIDEAVLPLYVRTICQLGRPEYLPEIFFLYANKPVPIPGTKPVKFKNPNPNSPKQAIPQELSDVALDTAILSRDLPLAMSVIDTTVATRAFRTNKLIRKASIPAALSLAFPLGIAAGADWLANWQNTLDYNTAYAYAMMGAVAYVGTFGTIGFVAFTTWNDHHDRVRWAIGTPLRQRWIKEEERLYCDRVAIAWGFQKTRRRGEEMGEEWEALRYELGLRSFILDQTNLLEGMM